MDGLTITGLDDCLKFFDNLPENLVDATRKAMKDGGRAVARQIRRKVPKRWNRLVKSKVTNKGNLYATIGMFNNKQAQGHQSNAKAPIDDWFKMYWSNYGTLEGRDPNHQFDYPVKHSRTSAAKNRRGQAGITHRNFFEVSIQGWRETFMQTFNESLKRHERDLYKR